MGVVSDQARNVLEPVLSQCFAPQAFVMKANLQEMVTALQAILTSLGNEIALSDGTVPINIILPVISGSTQVGAMLTTTNGAWTNNPSTFTYQWNRNGVPIAPGAQASFYFLVSADVGNTITVTIIANNGIGLSPPATSLATSVVTGLIPVNTTLPSISGTAQVGQTLTAAQGIWTNIPDVFTYQWNRGGTAIVGATASTYVPVAADVGALLTISVVATNASGPSLPATSGSTASVIDIIPTNTSVPVISGTAQVGQTLTATSGTWTHNPTSYGYQWNRLGAAIAGATSSTYVLVAADTGDTLTVSVIATNSGGPSSSATSAATAAVTAAGAVPSNTAIPVVTGTAQAGQTLTATNGTWTNSPTGFTYQWNRAGAAINGATASTYLLATADIGSIITCSVIAMNAIGSSAAATSLGTAAVIDIAPAITTAPALSGTPQVGVPFTATAGVWTHNPTFIARQWKSAGVNATGAGATTLTYTPVAGDVGNTLTITETATNSGGSASSTSSASASVIAAAGGGSLVFSASANSNLIAAIAA
jgi:hypothetical protein